MRHIVSILRSLRDLFRTRAAQEVACSTLRTLSAAAIGGAIYLTLFPCQKFENADVVFVLLLVVSSIAAFLAAVDLGGSWK